MKTIEQINRAIAEEKGLPFEVVRAVNDYFWRKGIRKNMTDITHRSIYIKNIGTITVSMYKLKSQISKIIKKIRAVRVSTKYKEETKQLILDKSFRELKEMLIKRNEMATEYYKNLLHEPIK